MAFGCVVLANVFFGGCIPTRFQGLEHLEHLEGSVSLYVECVLVGGALPSTCLVDISRHNASQTQLNPILPCDPCFPSALA